jgi:KRAB domain-containing zinc finger protein
LGGHLRTHQNKRDFECKICEKAFSRKTSLNNHLALHQTAKYFKCLECGKLYQQKGRLEKSHEKSHVITAKFEN